MKLGTPTEAVWPGLSELPDFKPTFPQWKPKGWANIRNTLPQVGPAGIDKDPIGFHWVPDSQLAL